MFLSIGPAFIDTNTCPRVLLKIVCGSYTNRTYIFASPAGFIKVVVIITVGFNFLLTSLAAFLYLKSPSSSYSKTYFLFLTFLFLFTVSAVIDPETFPRVQLQIVCGTYTNRKYIFDSSASLWKVMSKVTVLLF